MMTDQLNAHRLFAVPEKAFDFKMLLDPLEEELHLPTLNVCSTRTPALALSRVAKRAPVASIGAHQR